MRGRCKTYRIISSIDVEENDINYARRVLHLLDASDS